MDRGLKVECRCPKCGGRQKYFENDLGRKGRCRGCGELFTLERFVPRWPVWVAVGLVALMIGIVICVVAVQWGGGGLAMLSALAAGITYIAWPRPPKAPPPPKCMSLLRDPDHDSTLAELGPKLPPGEPLEAFCLFVNVLNWSAAYVVVGAAHVHLLMLDGTRGLALVSSIPMARIDWVRQETVPLAAPDGSALARAFSTGFDLAMGFGSPLMYLTFQIAGRELLQYATPYLDGFDVANAMARKVGAEAAPVPTMAEQMEALANLKREGILTAEDWELVKRRFLGAAPSKAQEAERALRELYQLLLQGILSESEFRQKKWDLLGRA